jgi:hypothetical protein
MHLDIAAYRLHNQHLSHNHFNQAADVVRGLGAVQAQDFAGAKWAIGLRSDGLADPDVQRAFDDGSILRTHLLRPTWHFVAAEDIRWMLALTAPRVRAQIAYMDRQLELDRAIFKKSNAVLIKVLQGGKQFTRAEIEPAFQKARIPAGGQRLGHILMHAELDAVICSGPRRGKQFTYALLEERVPAAKAISRDESLAELVKRYFFTRGPATFKDFCVWSGLTMADARNGMEMVKTQFETEIIDNQTYYLAETEPFNREKSPKAYLLPNYDEYFIGFKDRSAIAKIAEQAGVKKEDPAFLANIIILDGQVIGGWSRTLKKDGVIVEASLITMLTEEEIRAVAQAAEQLGEFLGLPVAFTQKKSSVGERQTRSF